jgi:methanogenic corrinoid protein MtbC1
MIQLADYFNISLDQLAGRKDEDYSDMIALSDQFLNYILNNELTKAQKMADDLSNTIGITEVYFKLFRYSLSKLGWLWEVGAITITKEHQVSYEISRMISSLAHDYKKHHEIKKNNCRILGMASPDEKHNIGLKMLMSLLEIEGFETLYIGEAVPVDDLLHQIDKGDYQLLVLSITNGLFHKKLEALIKQLDNIPTVVVGNGAPYVDYHEKYRSYEKCLEAIKCQKEILMKEIRK